MYSLLTIVFAYCSMVYELFLAQTLTSVLGGTNLRYAMTIGLYITSMGIGAWLLRPLLDGPKTAASAAAPGWRSGKSAHQPQLLLVGVEIVLMSLGLLVIPYVLFIDRLRGELASAWGLVEHAFFDGFFAVAFQVPIVLIGILSGLELPLLMKCAKDEREHGAASPAVSGVFQADILAWDYVGTVLGALLFPFLLLPMLGVFGVSYVTVLINAVATMVVVICSPSVAVRSGRPGRYRMFAMCAGFAAVAVVFLTNAQGVQSFFVNQVYLAHSQGSIEMLGGAGH
jgi:spermidine synthase